nr:hypothetical protein [Tanacetum cinerariifolium]
MAPLPPRDQRHLWLPYQRRLFEIRAPLVQEFILEFLSTCKIGSDMGLDLVDSLCFQLGGDRRSMAWRQFIRALGLHTAEEMTEDGFGTYFLGSERAPEKVTATDLFYLRIMDRGAANVLYLLAKYLFRHAEGRKSDARLSRGHFIGHFAHHFGLVRDDGLRGLLVVAHELSLIDMERQQVAAASTPEATEDAHVVDEGAQANPAPVQTPQLPPPPPAAGRTMLIDWGDLRRRFREYVGMSGVCVDLWRVQ